MRKQRHYLALALKPEGGQPRASHGGEDLVQAELAFVNTVRYRVCSQATRLAGKRLSEHGRLLRDARNWSLQALAAHAAPPWFTWCCRSLGWS